MYNDDATAKPRTESHFWDLIEENFEYCRVVLNDHHLETKADALSETSHRPMEVIRYRQISPEYDQREHFLKMGRGLLPIVRRLINKREVSPIFLVEWGKLMFCHGLIAGFVFDDSDDLGQNRRSLRAASEKRNKSTLLKRWLARVHMMPQFRLLPRKAADDAIAKRLVHLRDSARASEYPKDWFENLLKAPKEDEDAELRPVFSRHAFPRKEIFQMASEPNENLPPLPIFPD